MEAFGIRAGDRSNLLQGIQLDTGIVDRGHSFRQFLGALES